MILATRFTLLLKEVEKNMYFTQKWLDRLLMTSCLVTIETYHHWTCHKMRARDKRTATENVRCWCFIVSEITEKKFKGGCQLPTLPSVRPMLNFQTITKTLTNWKSIWNKDFKKSVIYLFIYLFIYVKLKEKNKIPGVK